MRIEVPDGVSPDAAGGWPQRGLIESFHGRFDFEPAAAEPLTDADAEAATRFRTVLGRFASGVTVVTAATAEGPVGMTCQSFSSVSLHPPLILFAPAKTSRAWARIRRAGHFAVNILAAGQEDVSNQFASRSEDKYAGVSWSPGEANGDPHVDGCVAYLDCTVQSVHEEGDHYLVVGRVLDLRSGDAEEPLLFYRSDYRELS